jgi:serine phosphatase RsbU (regulator of sigma subunit)
MKNNIRYLLPLLFFLSAIAANSSAQNFVQDSLRILNHDHTPLEYFAGDGNESIVCYKQTHRNIFFGFTLFSVVLLFVTIKFLMLAKKSKRILLLKNSVIEEKNKSITDSINYAKRLQNALLPSVQSINKILPEHFIYYAPKDIVSGDFYWVSKHSNKYIVAAIDCTGHGVPGSLLSVIGHNALDKVVNELGLLQPATIIESMSKIIQNILHQEENNDIRDGMDMALCCIDNETLQLEYAGANNPIYIFRNNQLEIIKGAHLSVGNAQDGIDQKPINHTVQLQNGDCFYLFSDGYVDQFGGVNGKKFKTKNLQSLLQKIHTQPMSEQLIIVKQTLESWQGMEEQVDDILVIGIRV